MKKKHVLYLFLIGLFIIISRGVYSDVPINVLKKKYANKQSKFVNIDGVQVHYRDEGVGTPIVLIHGTAASLHTWNYWASALQKKYRVIRMDLPAFGLTGPNKNGTYSLPYYIEFLHKFLTKIQVDSLYLAGNSLGGNIAWNYAAKYPKKIKKMILIDASGLPTHKPQPWIFKLAKTPILNSFFLYFTPKWIIKDNIKQVYFDNTKISKELITQYHDMALRKGNRKAFLNRAKMSFKKHEEEGYQKLKNIPIETLLIWGKHDAWIPLKNGILMDSLLPNSKLVVLENSGHVPMEENPKESLLFLQEFINSQ